MVHLGKYTEGVSSQNEDFVLLRIHSGHKEGLFGLELEGLLLWVPLIVPVSDDHTSAIV